MFIMTLIVKHFMGKVGHYNSLVSLVNWSKELGTFDVVKVVIEGVIQGVDV